MQVIICINDCECVSYTWFRIFGGVRYIYLQFGLSPHYLLSTGIKVASILDPRIIINEPLEYTFMSNTQDAIKGLVRKNNLKKWGENNKEIVNLNLKKPDILRLYRSVNETRILHSRMYEFGRKRD